MAEFVKIEGLDLFARALKLLPQKVAGKSLRRAVAAAGKVVRDEAKIKAPVLTGPVAEGHPPPGTLKRAIAFGRSRRNSGAGREVFNVFVRQAKNGSVGQKGVKRYGKFDAYYARFVEFGTSKMAARPFLRPAFEAKKNDAAQAIGDTLAKELAAEVPKLGFQWVKK